MSSSTATLRGRLSQDLSTLSGSSHLTAHLLITSPRKSTSLFPHSSLPQKRRVKILQQDYFILLSQAPLESPNDTSLVSAVEIVVYSFATSDASIVYVSKVDSTGQNVSGSGSPTAALVKSLLRFFTDASTRPSSTVRIQLFARAQSQYIFPNSSSYSGKRVLSDVELCRWWKGILTDVIETRTEHDGAASASWKCFYVFPGLSETEATNMLKSASVLRSNCAGRVAWVYDHPYSSPDSTSFSFGGPSSSPSPLDPIGIFDVIPTFSDDPKARFLVELAATDNAEGGILKPPVRKRFKSHHHTPDLEAKIGAKEVDEEEDVEPGSVKSAKQGIAADEFWERMGFRQECSLGAVTGFFFADSVAPSTSTSISASAPDDTSEAAMGYIPPPMLNRITASLMNLDFSSTEKARQATQLITESIKGLCSGLMTEDKPTSTPDAAVDAINSDAPPLLLSRPSNTDDFYSTHIMTTFAVRNQVQPKSGAIPSSNGETPNSSDPPLAGVSVNVLQVRKKKRPAAA